MCLHHVHVVLGILRLQDRAVQHLPQLREALRAHHNLLLRLYPQIAKPKLHYMWHVADCLSKRGANLSRFTPERRHKLVKSVAKHTFRYIEPHVLSKLLNEMIHNAQTNVNLCTDAHLGPSRPTPWAMEFVGVVYRNVVEVLASSEARLKYGFAAVGDLLWFQSEEILGSACAFIEIVLPNEKILLVQVHAHRRLDDKNWADDGGPMLLSLDLASQAVPYVRLNGGAKPLFPSVW